MEVWLYYYFVREKGWTRVTQRIFTKKKRSDGVCGRSIIQPLLTCFTGIPNCRTALDHHADRVGRRWQLGHVQHMRRIQTSVRHYHRRIGHRPTVVRRPGGHQSSPGVGHRSLRGRGA